MSKTNLAYDVDLKEQISHVEYDANHHVDLHDAAAAGHLATDERGNPLVDIDEVASRKLARKIDMYIVPIVALQYLFAFIDRANIGNARLAGLEKDLKLVKYDYNLLLSMFYVSYIIFEIPANLFTKWLGPGKSIPLYTITFGLLSVAFAFVRNKSAAYAVRFLLGVAEAVCAPLAGAFGGLLASGILKIDNIGSVVRWEMIFLIEGIITTIIGIASYFLMTDRIETAKWLSQEEKDLANARIKREQVGATVVLDKLHSRAVKQGIFAPTTLAIGFIFLVNNITVQGLAFFTPTIVASIFPTKSTVHKQLFTVPPYLVGACFTLIFPYISMRIKKRGLFLCIAAPMIGTGFAIFLATKNTTARYVAVFFAMSGAFVGGPMCTSWTAINVASDTSRAAALGWTVMMGNIGGLISTWSFLPTDAKKGNGYPIGNGLNLACSITMFFVAAGCLVFIKTNNKKRERGDYDHYLHNVRPEDAFKLGNNHPGFRYKE
ncbi:hypothetical protein QFC24_000044 [Naganishia onofrii]|uniref:Uncharacterized protein n=1 Tax=Naganishia onofrii TaxID=1851511 RepID=A0ACC2XVV7_9TREE|nr:hypothetical protein QFC24_000044 [Naganishia onofrii]